MINFTRKPQLSLALLLFSALLLAAPDAAVASVMPSDDPGALVLQAENAYEQGNYDEALHLAEKLDNHGNDQVDRMHGYRLQGLVYVAQGKLSKAQKSVDELVLMNPTFTPENDAPTEFKRLVADARSRHDNGELKASGGDVMQWVYYGIVAAGTGLVVALSAQDW